MVGLVMHILQLRPDYLISTGLQFMKNGWLIIVMSNNQMVFLHQLFHQMAGGIIGLMVTDWTSSIAIIPWNIYMFYGDKKTFELL